MENLNQESVNNYENGQSGGQSINEVHTIGDYQTTVGVAHQEHPLDTPMDICMVNETRLSDLNDECLETIFSLEFISITDLCAVARTNHRLKYIANRQFSLNYETCNIPSLVNKISDAKRVIVTFGFFISDLAIEDDDDVYENWWLQCSIEDRTSLLILVIRCCSETLDTLQIDTFFIPKYLTSGLKKLFSNLRKLCIYYCTFQSFEDLFADCKKLIELKVCGEIFGDDINSRILIDNVFPKLERLHYDVGHCKNLTIFLLRHKNLKSLNILRCEDSFFLLPIIAINCRHLEELEIDFLLLTDGEDNYEKVVESFQMLEHLQKLVIKCDGDNITDFIPKLISLKSLKCLALCDVKADSEFITALLQLKRLQVLQLIGCEKLVNLNRLPDLNQLTELYIHSGYSISLDIVSLVRKLNSLKTLNIWVETYKLDKKMYLNLVNVVRNRSIRSQQSLEIGCLIAEDAVADLQNVGNNREIVKLFIGVK